MSKPPGCFLALMTADERVLTIVRGKAVKNGGQYALPGGRAEDEDALFAAERECEEELGLKVDVWSRPFLRLVNGRTNVFLVLWEPTPEQAKHVEDLLAGKLPNPEEVATVQWMRWSEFAVLPIEKVHKSLDLLTYRWPERPANLLSVPNIENLKSNTKM